MIDCQTVGRILSGISQSGSLRVTLGVAGVATALAFAASAAPAQTPAEGCAAGAADGYHWICKAAVAANPADPALRRLYAISLQKAGHYERALREYAKVANLSPDRFQAHYELGWMLAFVRRYHDAVASLERAARLRPRHVGVHRALTISFAMLKQPDRALRTALAGARLGDRIAMYDAARHYRHGLGVPRDPRRALLWLERAAAAGHVKAMDDLARVYLHGELGEKPDDKRAEYWANRGLDARK